MIKLIYSLALIIFVSACDVSVGVRSGTVEDDYIEEPLSGSEKEYVVALETSNLILDAIKVSNLEACYENYFSVNLKSKVTRKKFYSLMQNFENNTGGLQTYKPMQWGFFEGDEEGLSLLYSVKIAEHKTNMYKYLFVFDKNGDYKKIEGFNFKARDGVSPSGKF